MLNHETQADLTQLCALGNYCVTWGIVVYLSIYLVDLSVSQTANDLAELKYVQVVLKILTLLMEKQTKSCLKTSASIFFELF